MNRSLNRRTFAGASVGLAASLPLIGASAQDATPAASPAASAGPPEDELEIFSWWTTGGEAAGLQELFDAFLAQWPDVEIINAAVAGGAGSNAKVALQTRLSGGEPPDSWQSHPGEELFSLYVDPGYTQTITDLWAAQGWADVFPQGLIDQVTRDDEQYLVPVGVHRGNVMFYNTQVLADNGVEVGEEMTVDQWMEIATTLEEAGIPALALGSQDSFAAPQLFENILLGELGPDGYSGLWDGSTGWDSDGVTAAIETFGQMLGYVNDNHPSLTWDGAMDLVIDGSAGFTSMGDWAYGQAISREAEANVGWVAQPDTAGSFVAVVDGFTLPVDAPHPNNAVNWLVTVGSAEAQTAFAPPKGAIPARTDIDSSSFNEYMQWSASHFADSTVVASMAHGAAASPQFQQSIFEATTLFLSGQDVAAYQDALVFAAEDAQLGQ